MILVNPRNMIRQYREWEKDRCPRVPFPTAYMTSCLFTLYFSLFLSAFLMYRILIIGALTALFFFLFSYSLFMQLWKLLGLSRWKFHLFFLLTGSGVCWLGVLLRTCILSFLQEKGW